MSGLLLARRSAVRHVTAATPTTVTASPTAMTVYFGPPDDELDDAADNVGGAGVIGQFDEREDTFFLVALDVPHSATISSATLTITQAGHDGTATDVAAICYGGAVDNATAPATTTAYLAGARTTASTTFTGTTDGADIAIDVTAIVQEIVSRSGWTSGNNAIIYLQDNGTPSGETDIAAPAPFPSISVTYT